MGDSVGNGNARVGTPFLIERKRLHAGNQHRQYFRSAGGGPKTAQRDSLLRLQRRAGENGTAHTLRKRTTAFG